MNIVPVSRASMNFTVFSSPCLLLFTRSLVLTHQQGQTLWKHTLQHSQKITLHNLNKYKAICHCHVRVAPFSVCPRRLSYPPPYPHSFSTPCLLCPDTAAGSSNGDCINPSQRTLTFTSVQLEVIVQEHTHKHMFLKSVRTHTIGFNKRFLKNYGLVQ